MHTGSLKFEILLPAIPSRMIVRVGHSIFVLSLNEILLFLAKKKTTAIEMSKTEMERDSLREVVFLML